MRSHALRLIAALALLTIFAPRAIAETPPDSVSNAARVYSSALAEPEPAPRRQLFRRSQSLYRREIEERDAAGQRMSPALLTDWGNAALQAGDLGVAVLAYLRALEGPDPDDRASRNLRVARKLIESSAPTRVRTVDDSILGRFARSTDDELSLVAALCFLAMALATGHHLRSPHALARAIGVLFGVAWVGVLTYSIARSTPDPVAVVTAREVIARVADAPGAPQKFSSALPGGVEVEVLEEREKWTRVRFGDGDTGWIPGSALTRVRE